MAHFSTPQSEHEGSTTATSSTSSDNDGILRNGRFQTVKVKEEKPSAAPHGVKGLATSKSFLKANGNEVGTNVVLPRKLARVRELDPEALCDDVNTHRDKLGRYKQLRRKICSIARNPRKFGFVNICLLLLVLSYTLLGAAVFFIIESKYERKTVAMRKAALDEAIASIAKEITKQFHGPGQVADETAMVKFIQQSYVRLLKIESAYAGSTYHKSEDNMHWNFGSSCFFAMNVFTTTGYGTPIGI
ncbi:hypothetical protein GCK32_015127 [Trichostrongylus colubriformis]|uniref:Potassium channel domain-containing protein n=1 Tax=Trichostrongylus colubriformis TaxID=6319 RepID=A0AAN8ILK5_TRICO